MSKFELAIDKVLKHEGGYVNDVVDPGGATNFGISLRYLQSEALDIDGDGDVDAEDIRLLSKEMAINIYKARWWDKYNYSEILNQAIAGKVFDTSVNVGAHQSHTFLQRSLNELFGDQLATDGVLGKVTLAAVNAFEQNSNSLLLTFKQQQVMFYQKLIEVKPEFEKYRTGWMRRANS